MKFDLARVFGGVEAGVKVDIKRSDGRIHEACVTGVNLEQQTVSVEWIEHEETKGEYGTGCPLKTVFLMKLKEILILR